MLVWTNPLLRCRDYLWSVRSRNNRSRCLQQLVEWLNCFNRKIAGWFRDNYDPFDNERFCVALVPERISAERDSELSTQALGLTPNRFSNARRNWSVFEKPTSSATLWTVFLGVERRRRASLRRKFSTNAAGVLPSTLVNARLKWLGDIHARRASVLTERSPCKFRIIHGTSSANRLIGWLSNASGFDNSVLPFRSRRGIPNSCTAASATWHP